MGSCGPVSTTASSSSKLSNTGGCPFHDQTLYRSIVGDLQYLTFPRPDIAYADTSSHGSSTLLHGYSDSDWGAKSVSRSSMEAEYYALAAAATSKMTWVEHLLLEIGCFTTSLPTLWCDNLSATYLTANLIFHSRTKHMEIDFHFVRDKARAKTLSVRYVSSHDQVADALTKPLSKVRFLNLKSKLTIVPLLVHLVGKCNDNVT
ncbi:hypothetical protein MTR67_017952 [Solanum verrucosum]|uniref:Uncharacterized protein n=1 Tax=Solanum verrucosum TaxID=315347 RepID=A0AAF0QIV6_SOLVR|nr:hypothetical protein MTR67_017952 [Solanum verrucosum]